MKFQLPKIQAYYKHFLKNLINNRAKMETNYTTCPEIIFKEKQF